MILIFTKQYRQEEKLIDLIARKIKKSKTMEKKYGEKGTEEANTEIYVLDDIDVYFNLGIKGGDNAITVKDKEGKEIYKMDCHYDNYDAMQQARGDWFHTALMKARDVYEKRTEKAKKLKQATEKAQKAKDQKDMATRAKQSRDAAIKEALEKLR
jgi:hypothetical protein